METTKPNAEGAQGVAEANHQTVPAKGNFIVVSLWVDGKEKVTKITPAEFEQNLHQFEIGVKADGKKDVSVKTKLQYTADLFFKHPSAKIDGKDAGMLIEAKVRLSDYETMYKQRNRDKSVKPSAPTVVDGF